MNHDVRTVQRWEILRMPIHRIRSTSHSPVVAFPEELDEWLQASPVRVFDVVNQLEKRDKVSKGRSGFAETNTSSWFVKVIIQQISSYTSGITLFHSPP